MAYCSEDLACGDIVIHAKHGTFRSRGYGPRGRRMWPIEEFIARRCLGGAETLHIRMLNGPYMEEGSELVLGWQGEREGDL